MTSNKPLPAKPYAVGRGKPPVHSRFQKGKSGNPSGRPKKGYQQKSPEAILRDRLLRGVKVAINGKRQEVPALEAVVMRLVQNAMEKDNRAAKLVVELAFKHIDMKRTLADLMGDRAVFEFTEEDVARFDKARLLEGVGFREADDDDDGKGGNDGNDGGKPTL